MKICYGIKNSHEPLFFKSFLNYFKDKGYEQHIIARDYIEVVPLLKQLGLPYKLIGKHYGGNKFLKLYGALSNVVKIALFAPKFDISITHANTYLIYASKLRGKKTITFTDNDLSFNLTSYNKLTDYLFVPTAISDQKLLDRGCDMKKLYRYNGYKEDIYIANYTPDPNFPKLVPFNKFITIRAEAVQAHYVPKDTVSIVPQLFAAFRDKGINILFLPRYKSDRDYALGFENVYMPDGPLNGLDVCYYSDAVLTGAGTFAREAAILNTPAVSFFPRNDLLSVDSKMIDEGIMIHSRDINEIVDYVTSNLSVTQKNLDLNRSKAVHDEVMGKLLEIMREI